jgi:hypothetical protein
MIQDMINSGTISFSACRNTSSRNFDTLMNSPSSMMRNMQDVPDEDTPTVLLGCVDPLHYHHCTSKSVQQDFPEETEATDQYRSGVRPMCSLTVKEEEDGQESSKTGAEAGGPLLPERKTATLDSDQWTKVFLSAALAAAAACAATSTPAPRVTHHHSRHSRTSRGDWKKLHESTAFGMRMLKNKTHLSSSSSQHALLPKIPPGHAPGPGHGSSSPQPETQGSSRMLIPQRHSFPRRFDLASALRLRDEQEKQDHPSR